MDPETLKLIGSGSAQLILAAGYIPAFWLVKVLWQDRAALGEKMVSVLMQQFADADKRKELWDGQAKVIDGQTTAIKDLAREVREGLQRIRP